jgi:hypothetical protein
MNYYTGRKAGEQGASAPDSFETPSKEYQLSGASTHFSRAMKISSFYA